MKYPHRLAWLTATLLATAVSSLNAALPGLTIRGETFTYNAPTGIVTGRLKLPTGPGPFPAVLISHGKGGTPANMMSNHGTLLVGAGLVCIAPEYTHAGTTVNTRSNEGYCPENSRRARACFEILQSLGNVDMARVGAFSHSMGSFLTIGLCGESGIGVRAAVISAGGTSGTSNTSLASPATTEVAGIVAPMLMVHGTTDTTVSPIQSANLAALLSARGVPHHRLLYSGVGHDIITTKKTDIHALLRAWFTEHGVLSSPTNLSPTMTAPATIFATAGVTSAPSTILINDTATPPASLTLSVFSTNDARLPASSLVLGGSGGTRSLTVRPGAGGAETAALALVVSDGQLSAVRFVNVSISNGRASLLRAASPPPTVNHRPTLSRIADQRTSPGVARAGLTFVVGDGETSATALAVAAASSNVTLLPSSAVTLGGDGANRTISLSPAAGQTGVATITLTVSDGEKSTATAFTLTVARSVAGNSPPVIQALPSEILAVGTRYGLLPLVIKDDESSEASLTLTSSSSNSQLVPGNAIVLSGQNWGRSVEITPAAGQTGRSTVTITVSDGVNRASTACVLEVVAENTPPVFTTAPTFVTQPISASESVVSFSVQDEETVSGNLRVTATSSNPVLLPNSGLVLDGTSTDRTLTLLPTPAATGAATITLTLSDGAFVRQRQVLFVSQDPSAPASGFQRPRGVFALDNSSGTSYRTNFGKAISLRDGGIRNLPFVDGFTLRMAWDDVESGTTPGTYDFKIVANALAKLPAGQRLSLIVVPDEPAYIAQTAGAPLWNHGGTLRACPWNAYLRGRRRAMIQALAVFVANGVPLASEPRLDVIDPYLPGGFTGIRDPNGAPLRTLTGYSRAGFLAAVQDEIRAWQDAFPGKFIQLGFWPVTDGENATHGGVSAWEWWRQNLLAEFNGETRPHIGFFMENLAAKRSGSSESPYSGTPVTAFASPLALSRDGAWTGFQMLGSWSRPFNDGHVNNTLNGTPADAMEYAFNTYAAEYHEVYSNDLDTPGYQSALQCWHDFYLDGS